MRNRKNRGKKGKTPLILHWFSRASLDHFSFKSFLYLYTCEIELQSTKINIISLSG